MYLIRGPTAHQFHHPKFGAGWPNGKALLSGPSSALLLRVHPSSLDHGKDCGFESHFRRVIFSVFNILETFWKIGRDELQSCNDVFSSFFGHFWDKETYSG